MPPEDSESAAGKRRQKGDELGDRDRLEHMLVAAKDAVSYAAGRSRADLESDSMLLRALIQCVEVIGEAAARTSEQARQRIPDLPWARVVGMRHILVHAYFDIDADAVWRVVINHLPPLIESLDRALADWEASG